MSANILVWIEQHGGAALPVAWEVLGAARQLADGGTVTALVCGQNVGEVVQQAFAYGADAVIKADDASLAHYRFAPYVALVVQVVKQHNPAAVLAGATTAGREVLAGAAADLDAGLLNDVTELTLTGGRLNGVHPVMGGKALSLQAVVGSGPQFAALRARAFKPLAPDTSRSGNVIEATAVIAENDINTKVESVEQETGKVSLTDASIIVSAGRGVGGPDGFAPVRELAEVLGAA
ncbi:MAG: electron transfer flavoprotein subunit alpha/FixB family protein, partial [Chloroflexi bacterium]|nr:electron transfer flavoprotein subunit alpha/FixB family protein [Chloroflexota bacterium]